MSTKTGANTLRGKPDAMSALESITLSIEGMTCSKCVVTIERGLRAIPGVSATIDLAAKTAHVMAPAELSPQRLISAIKSAGYSAIEIGVANRIALRGKKSATALFFALVFTAPVLAIAIMSSWHPAIDRWILTQLSNFNLPAPLYSPTFWLVIGLSAPVVLIIAWPIHRAGLRNILHPTMDTLIMLASLTAFGWSIYANITGEGEVYAQVSATIILTVIAGRFLEFRVKRRASRALVTLLALESKEVTVIRQGELISIPREHLKIGDQFIAEPGERIATDGVVISGESAVNNSLITGESKTIDVIPGASVIGSSLNLNAQLVIRATRVGPDTEIARLKTMVITAQGIKAPIQRLADRISAVLVPVVILASIGTFLFWEYTNHPLAQSISSAIAVLIIASPCALGLVTPVALLVASGRGAQQGIIIRQPKVLAVARKIDSVILETTGILTNGRMSLSQMHVVASAGSALGPKFHHLLSDEVILSSALSIELQSDHPVASAIATSISAKGIKAATVSSFSSTPGSGSAGRVNLESQSPVVLIGSPEAVAHATTPFHQELTHAIFQAQAKGLTVSVLAWDGIALAMFAVGDEIKADAKETIAEFKELGIDPWLVTGDRSQVAISTSREVGIDLDHVISGALSRDKVEQVRTLQTRGDRVLMIGHGVNDVASLASADLSVAMGAGTETTMATADIVLMRGDLGSVIDALYLSSKTLQITRSNLAVAILYNIVGLPLAALGVLHPMYAAAAMAFSSLFVATNSLRIK